MQNTSTSPPKTPREDGSVPVTNWSYEPYKWSYKWVPGVRTRVSLSGILILTGRTPLCGSWRAHVWKPCACSKKLQLPGTKNHRDFFGGRTSCPTTCGHLVFLIFGGRGEEEIEAKEGGFPICEVLKGIYIYIYLVGCTKWYSNAPETPSVLHNMRIRWREGNGLRFFLSLQMWSHGILEG